MKRSPRFNQFFHKGTWVQDGNTWYLCIKAGIEGHPTHAAVLVPHTRQQLIDRYHRPKRYDMRVPAWLAEQEGIADVFNRAESAVARRKPEQVQATVMGAPRGTDAHTAAQSIEENQEAA